MASLRESKRLRAVSDADPQAGTVEVPWALDDRHDAYFSIDAQGRVTEWNAVAEGMFGWTAGEAVGRPLSELIIPESGQEAHRQRLKDFVATVNRDQLLGRRFELTACRRDHSELALGVTMSPSWIGDELTLHGFARDITERKRAEADQRRLADIVEFSEDAILSLSPDGLVTSWNGGAERLYGYTAEEMVGGRVNRLVPLEDMPAKEDWYERVIAGEPIDHQQARRIRKDGTIVDVSLTLSAMRDEDGRLIVLSVIARDVSDRIRAERELSEARERFEGAFNNAPIGMALVGLDGRFLMVNASACAFTGRSEQELLALDVDAITHPGDRRADHEGVRRVLSGEVATFEVEKRYPRRDGELVWAHVSVSVVRDTAATPLYFIRQMHDITARKAAEDELRRYAEHLNALAIQEPLTELYNKRGFQAALDQELARARRHGGAFTVALFDIDHFGEFNRLRGSDAGDVTLRAVGAALQRACRTSDTAARIGGDEFALILPETLGLDARATARRIQEQIGALEDDFGVSMGLAAWPADGDTTQLLLLRADMDLHGKRPARAEPGYESHRRRLDPLSIQRVLELARDELDMEVAYLSEFRDGDQIFQSIDGDAGSFGVKAGSILPLEGSYCQRMVSGLLDSVITDVAGHPDTRDMEITREAGVGAYVGVPLELSDGHLYGTLCCVSHAPHPELGERESTLMTFLARVVAQQLESEELQAGDRRAQIEVAGIQGLVAALEARDYYTGEHSRRVVELARTVSRELGMSAPQILEVEQIALLHDIGKVGIPDSILQKRGLLTEEEWQLMRQHPAIAARILARSPSLSHLAPAVRAEHERWDGGG
ncbi:MAG: hypothetical protein QOF27_2975, partial [Gaiellaceae bacterium]|nr:hypothetical protein [Gaiellaceae bacterium]